MRCHHLIPSWQRGCTFKFRRIFLHTLDLSAKAGFASGQGPAIQALNAMLADIARTDFGKYTAEEYLDDLGRITQYYIDPDLAETLVKSSTDTVHWLMERGVKFLPNYGRQAYNHEGKFKFFGGVVIYANGGGAGLVQSEYKAAVKHGVTLWHDDR